MTESYLRKDFHFAMYLSYCYGKVLVKFFKWSLFTLLLLFTVVVILNIVFEYLPGDEISLYIGFSLLFICFLALILIRSCLSSAERKITPSAVDDKTQELSNPVNFNVLFNQRAGPVDPFG
jgi:ABC-type transport system involved in multi-copper enzyme maturation permease subunit